MRTTTRRGFSNSALGSGIGVGMGLATSLACGGTALPEALPAARPSTVPQFPGAPEMPNRQFTRPLCVYPEFATYRGSGNPDAAASFECMTP